MDLVFCCGNRYDVISAFKVLPNNRVAKIFIVCLHYELSFFGIFHRFTKAIATKKTLSSLLKSHFPDQNKVNLRSRFTPSGSSFYLARPLF